MRSSRVASPTLVSLRHAVLLAALAFVLAPLPAAQARVALVATGTAELALLDVSSDRIVASIALPAPSTAVAVDSDGRRGFVAAGATIVSLDVNERTEITRRSHGSATITGLALSRDGDRLYAVQGTRLRVLRASTLELVGSVGLGGRGSAVALGRADRLAAVVLNRGRVAMVDARARRLLRRVPVPGATGVAVVPDGATIVSARGSLRTIPRGARRAGERRIRLPRGAGGNLALSPGRTRLAVGPRRGGRSGALVVLRSRRVRRLAAGGNGPGTPAWTPDANRLFFANRASGTLTLVSPFSRKLLDTVRVGGGSSPRGIVVQPGLALIRGTSGDDTLVGTRSRDRIEGLEGNDLLRGGRDRDVLEGGPGNDSLSGGALSDRMSGGEGNDFLTSGTGNDTIHGGAGDDAVDGGTGNDTIDAEDGNDRLDGGDGDDTIRAGEGDDEIVEQGFGNDLLLSGGPGDDTIRGGRGSDRRILGDDGNDELFGESGSEAMSGGRGDDTVDGGAGGDNMRGDEGNDILRGGRGNDRLDGGPGQDRLDGSSGSDDLQGGDDNDEVVGGPGVDTLRGGAGDDSIRAADDSADIVECGPGNDTVYVEEDAPDRDRLSDCELVVRTPPEGANDAELPSIIQGTVNDDVLQGTSDDDSIFGKLGDDRLFGRDGDDYVDGEDGDDELRGGPGNDIMAGRDGNDEIHGDAGNDRITGDRGSDRIFGGDGNDQIFGNIDADFVDGGAGDDRINVVAGDIDVVTCGSGRTRCSPRRATSSASTARTCGAELRVGGAAGSDPYRRVRQEERANAVLRALRRHPARQRQQPGPHRDVETRGRGRDRRDGRRRRAAPVEGGRPARRARRRRPADGRGPRCRARRPADHPRDGAGREDRGLADLRLPRLRGRAQRGCARRVGLGRLGCRDGAAFVRFAWAFAVAPALSNCIAEGVTPAGGGVRAGFGGVLVDLCLPAGHNSTSVGKYAASGGLVALCRWDMHKATRLRTPPTKPPVGPGPDGAVRSTHTRQRCSSARSAASHLTQTLADAARVVSHPPPAAAARSFAPTRAAWRPAGVCATRASASSGGAGAGPPVPGRSARRGARARARGCGPGCARPARRRGRPARSAP